MEKSSFQSVFAYCTLLLHNESDAQYATDYVLRRQPLASGEELYSLVVEAIWQRYERMVKNYLFKLTPKNVDLVDDFTQDVFLKMYTCLHQLKGEQVSTWMLTIARNSVLANFRKSQHELPLLNPEKTIDVRQSWRYAGQHRDLENASLLLTSKEYELFVLVYIEGFTPLEVATTKGVHPVTLRVQLNRIRGKLKSFFKSKTRPRK